MNTDLTKHQKDYAHFLPALSTFYATFIGKQRFINYVDPSRFIPPMTNGMESLNWLNQNEGIYKYKWSLYSAGHAILDINKKAEKEDMIRNRDRDNTWMLGDSGGFQIGKGVWEGDWKDPNCPKAKKKRELVLTWMDAYMDYGMILDIPTWVRKTPEGRAASGINTFQEGVNGTQINNDYFMKNKTGACKFLNVLQGENHTEADEWYDQMKKYCDPKQYTDHFGGWAMGGQNMCDIHLAIKRLIALRFDGLLEKGVQDVMHFLGTSKLEWALMLTDLQRAIRKNHNENFMITFDCASPFLATANGQVYCATETPDRGKWAYRMEASFDDRKFHTDPTPFADAWVREGCWKVFEDSPISIGMTAKDVCVYGPNDKNKIGKIGFTSWDSFSYCLLMSHNVWTHLNAVQEANRQYDKGIVPGVLVREMFDVLAFRDVVNDIFATDDRDKANALNDEYQNYLDGIRGTRGFTGKKMKNATTFYNNLFEEAS